MKNRSASAMRVLGGGGGVYNWVSQFMKFILYAISREWDTNKKIYSNFFVENFSF